MTKNERDITRNCEGDFKVLTLLSFSSDTRPMKSLSGALLSTGSQNRRGQGTQQLIRWAKISFRSSQVLRLEDHLLYSITQQQMTGAVPFTLYLFELKFWAIYLMEKWFIPIWTYHLSILLKYIVLGRHFIEVYSFRKSWERKWRRSATETGKLTSAFTNLQDAETYFYLCWVCVSPGSVFPLLEMKINF